MPEFTTQVERVQGSGKKQLPGIDRRRPDSYMPEEVEDCGACPRGSLNPEPRTLRPEELPPGFLDEDDRGNQPATGDSDGSGVGRCRYPRASRPISEIRSGRLHTI